MWFYVLCAPLASINLTLAEEGPRINSSIPHRVVRLPLKEKVSENKQVQFAVMSHPLYLVIEVKLLWQVSRSCTTPLCLKFDITPPAKREGASDHMHKVMLLTQDGHCNEDVYQSDL